MPDIKDTTPQFQPIANGTNRSDRALPALDPSYAMIDGGEIIDKVFYTLKMARNLQYFNISGLPAGTWDSLLDQNPYFLLATIYQYDVVKLISSNKGEEAILNALAGTGQAALQTSLSELLSNLDGTVGKNVSGWINSLALYVNEPLNTFKFHLVNLADELGKISGALQQIADRLNGKKNIERAQLNNEVTEIKDALKKLKRYFYSLNKRAKDVFNSQLASDKNIAPQIALFLAFLECYDAQRMQLNSLTAKHLDYCYSGLLGLAKSAAKEDSTFVAFMLTDTPGLNTYTILSGTALDAGNDANNLPIVFTTDKTLTVTKVTVPDFKTLFISYLSKFNRPASDTESFSFGQLDDEQKAIVESALNIMTVPGGDERFTDEDLGLILASPLFYIEDGLATITLSLTLSGLNSQIIKDIGPSPFSIYMTSAAGWRKVANYAFNLEGEQMVIKFGYDAMTYPITSYDPKIYTEGYLLNTPAIKINLRRQDVVSPYIYMVNLVISKVDISVQVSRSKKVRVQTNLGLVGPGNPFQAFGPAPALGAYFDIRNANIFNKYLDSLKIHIQWMGLPPKPGGFDKYYEKYNSKPFNGNLINKEFKVNLEALTGSANYFGPLNITSKNEFLLFATEADMQKDKQDILKDKTVVAIKASDNHLGFQNSYSLANEQNLDFSKPGIVRLTLISPDAGFGLDLFPSLLAYYVAKKAQSSFLFNLRSITGNTGSATTDSQSDDPKILPNQPYIPVIKSLAVDYELNFSRRLDIERDSDDGQLTIIHIYPFAGYKTIYPYPAPSTDILAPECRLLPQFNKGNNLFIPLVNFESGGLVNLLFILKADLIENDFNDPAPVAWYYLRSDQWVNIDSQQVSSDSTNAFTQSGIINLNVPADLTVDNTLMPAGLAWLLAATDEDDPTNSMARNFGAIVSSIQNNAVSATRTIVGQSDPGVLAMSAGTISQLVTRVPAINSVLQPLPSLGGLAAMGSDSFYLSISERLRHKSRPISAWEMERIVLDKFPEIRYVKCINFKNNSKHIPKFEPRPDILAIVVSDSSLSATGSGRVPFATLANIKSLLAGIISADLNVAVTNPHNERLRIKCAIEFKNGDTSKSKDFDEDFAAYLNPWLDDPSKDVEIVSAIHIADILGYLSNRPYVENIRDMVLVHIFEKGLITDTGIEPAEDAETEIEDDTEYFLEEVADNRPVYTFLPYGMFVAAPSYFTQIIDSGDDSGPQFMGIGELTIDDDFRLSPEIPAGQADPGINSHIAEGQFSFVINVPNT